MTSLLQNRIVGLPVVALIVALVFALAGCGGTPAPSAGSIAATGDGHGRIEGARELAEPALHLTTVDPGGTVHHLDLLAEQTEVLADIESAEDVVSDGRRLFVVRDGSVSIVDSGVWTWSHVDHFHYYEAPAELLGEVRGAGVAQVVANDFGVGVLFEREAVLLDTAALADGEIEERFRVDVAPHGGFLVPLADGAFLVEAGESGAGSGLRVLSSDGVEGERVACPAAAGTIATVVGVVIGCADGALLAVGGSADDLERVPYPGLASGDAPAATAFAGRKGRPTVAAVAGDSGIWMLDTRERAWQRWDVGEPIVRAAAVDDEEQLVIALTAEGAVVVLSGATGSVLGRTEPLVGMSLADPATAPHVDLVVDQSRIYLNGPAERMLWELDPADGARIAREFRTDHAPLHLAGTGR